MLNITTLSFALPGQRTTSSRSMALLAQSVTTKGVVNKMQRLDADPEEVVLDEAVRAVHEARRAAS